MRIKPRRMKKYTPRRRRSSEVLQKQQLKDFEHILSMDLSSFLILKEEGTPKQIDQARVKVRSDLMKYGTDMEAIARDLGLGLPELVRNYVKSMKEIVVNAKDELDPALLNDHRKLSLEINKIAA